MIVPPLVGNAVVHEKPPRLPYAIVYRLEVVLHGSARNQCSYSLHLFEQRNFGAHYLGDFANASIVFRDSLLQRFDFP
jgi:hypothetical protein